MEYNFNTEYEKDAISCANTAEYKNFIQESKQLDKGYNKIYRIRPQSNGNLKNTKIEFYTSSGVGTNIRDAETGEYQNGKVGSTDEDLFFKVALATGECNSKNGSSTLFYSSPQQYMYHMNCNLNAELIAHWEEKYQARLNKKKLLKYKQNKL